MEHALAVHLEEFGEKVKIEDAEPRDGLHELGQASDETRLPESVEEGALWTGHAEVDPLALDLARTQATTVVCAERPRIRKKEDPDASQGERAPPPPREDGADVPVRVGDSEEFKRRVVGKHGVLTNGRGGEIAIRHERSGIGIRRDHRIDATGNRPQPTPSDVVLDPLAGRLAGVGPRDHLCQIAEREHRTAGQR